MTMRQRTKREKLTGFNMTGLNGNAFSLLGNFAKYAEKAGWTKEEIDEVREDAKSGDYNHLLVTLMEFEDDDAEEGDYEFYG